MREKTKRATNNHALYTVVGQVGVDGLHAVNPVQLVFKNVSETVRVDLRVTAGTIAPETGGKTKHATNNYAPYTVVGQVGVDGLHAVNPVQLVFKNVPETARVHLRVTAGTIAMETRGKTKRATNNHALYTVVGQVGVVGLHAVNPVQLVFKNVPETARVRLHVTAGTIVMETRGKTKRATNNHALYTVVGQVGVVGLHAVNPVQLVFKNVSETVRVDLHVTAGNIALEMRGKTKRATNNNVLSLEQRYCRVTVTVRESLISR
ncbi:hypothetical protein ACROYT_G017737 [Oculina patagonica]